MQNSLSGSVQKSYMTFGDNGENSSPGGLVFRMDFERDGGDAIVSNIQHNVRQLSEQVSQLEAWIPRLNESSQFGGKVREQFNEKAQEAQFLGKETNILMKDLVNRSNADRSLKVHRERLQNEFIGVLNRLQSAQRKAVSTEKESIKQSMQLGPEGERLLRVRNEAIQQDEESKYQQQAVDAQQQLQMQRQNQLNLQEIKERQTALTKLEREVSDVNQLFADLAQIVHEQGDMVDSIEANVEHAAIHVEQGASNVQQAVQYQQKARQKKCMLFAFLAVLCLIIGLTVYLGAK